MTSFGQVLLSKFGFGMNDRIEIPFDQGGSDEAVRLDEFEISC